MSNPDGLDNRNWIVGNLVYKFLHRLGQFVMQKFHTKYFCDKREERIKRRFIVRHREG